MSETNKLIFDSPLPAIGMPAASIEVRLCLPTSNQPTKSGKSSLMPILDKHRDMGSI
jgi:hypothetical protein